MQKRLLTTVCLFLIVGALVIVFLLSDKQKADDNPILLSNIETTSISQITVQRTDKEDIVFQKQGDAWFMISAIKTRASMARINTMLDFLQSRSLTQIDVKDTPLTPYQLDQAAIILRLDDHEFFFGTTDPLDDRRYVLFNNTVHLVNDTLFHQLQQSPMFFVSTRLIPERETISTIQFSDYLVSKTRLGWSLTPVNNAVSSEQLLALTDAWRKGQAHQVSLYRAIAGKEKIIVKFNSGHTAQFDIVSKTPELVLGRSDLALQYHLPEPVAALLLVPQTNANE